MSDIRSFSKKIISVNPVVINSYSVNEDKISGFNVSINWNYEDTSDIAFAFKVYKCRANKPMLDRSYTITQQALEATTPNLTPNALNTILYNKSMYVQSSKVSFFSSSNFQHTKQDEQYKQLSFKEVAMILYNKNLKNFKYEFVDKNVKFGETYFYYVSVIGKNLKQYPSQNIQVNIENLVSTPKPNVSVSQTESGILLNISNKKTDYISKYRIYRREGDKLNFELINELQNFENAVYFIDSQIIPKKIYFYKIYSVDIYGNMSNEATEVRAEFDFLFKGNQSYKPSILISKYNNKNFQLKIKNNYPDIVKFIRIERKDDWRREKSFNIKDYNGTTWPNFIKLSSSVYDFIDYTAIAGRSYSYRITSFDYKTNVVSYTVTPSINNENTYLDSNLNIIQIKNPKFNYVNVSVVNSKQDPCFVKFEWSVNGYWSYINVIVDEKTKIRIDNEHQFAFLDVFKPNNTYNVVVELYDVNNQVADIYKNISLNLK